jgi:hypothetical protein
MDTGATRQGHGDFFITIDPKNWKGNDVRKRKKKRVRTVATMAAVSC